MTKDPLSLGLVSKVLAGYWHWRPSYWTCPSSASSRPLPPSGCWTGQTPAWCPATWRWSSSREWWRSPGQTPENHSWDADQRIINLWPWEYPWYGLLYKHWTTTVKSLYNSNCLHPQPSPLLPSTLSRVVWKLIICPLTQSRVFPLVDWFPDSVLVVGQVILLIVVRETDHVFSSFVTITWQILSILPLITLIISPLLAAFTKQQTRITVTFILLLLKIIQCRNTFFLFLYTHSDQL